MEHSKAWSDKPTWKKLWTLNVPPKVRTFMWRACSKNLPIRDNLCRRKVHVTKVCGLCQQKPKTIGHILWECPLAKNVWALVKGKIQKWSNEARDFFLLFGFMVQSLDQRDLKLWATVAWSIWNAWNKVYFEQKQTHPRTILSGAEGLLNEYQKLMASRI